MATQSERKALLFLGVVACLGGGVRLLRANAPPPAVAATHHDTTGPTGHRKRVTPPKPARPIVTRPAVTVVIPPHPKSGPDRFHPLDVDHATVEDLQLLPGIGPTLAARIIAYRDSAGGFGSLEALGKVKGIGDATLKRLDTLVRFSGKHRP